MPESSIGSRHQLASAAYENAGREITQAFSTLNFNTALAAGVLATVLGTLGAGELFGGGAAQAGAATTLPQLSIVSNFVLVLSAPLLFRFFIRALLGYQNLLRWNLIQREAWRYMAGAVSWEAFTFVEHMYGSVEEWRSPRSMWSLLHSNIEYGFFWIFAALLIPLAWSYRAVWDEPVARWTSLGILAFAVLGEVVLFLTHRRPFFRTLSAVEKDELDRLRKLPKPQAPTATSEACFKVVPTAGQVEERQGVFIGRTRRFGLPD